MFKSANAKLKTRTASVTGGAPVTRAKQSDTATALAVAAKKAPARLKVLSTRHDAGFKELVSQIEKTYGVKVADQPKATKNPYKMSETDALAVARRAGLITKSGKLAGTFK